jgi:hypothetical protein
MPSAPNLWTRRPAVLEGTVQVDSSRAFSCSGRVNRE